MKIMYQLTDKCRVEIEADSQKDAFKKLAAAQEILSDVCGKCKSTNLKFQVREHDGNDYYEIKCMDCMAALSFGQHKNNVTLFPKRKDGETWLADRGWLKWNKETQTRE